MGKTEIFFLGILGGLVLFGIGYAFVGMFKNLKNQKNQEEIIKEQINDLAIQIQGLQSNLSLSFKEIEENIDNSNNGIWKYIDQLEGTINEKNEYIFKNIDQLEGDFNKKNEDLFRYIDSRIDKTRDSIFSTIEILAEKKDKVIGVSDEI